jgi:glycosyltransferase involved in cell wall biosynthesis
MVFMRICLILQYALAPDLNQRIAAGEHPETEISSLACKLQAQVIDYNLAGRSRSFLVRAGFFVWRPLGPVLLAWQRRRDFDVFYVGNERQGMLAAVLFKFLKRRPHLVVFDHHLSSPNKAFLFTRVRLQNSIDTFICPNEYQATFLERELIVPERKVVRVHYGGMVDGSFFCPQTPEAERGEYVLSVGRENRDYGTFFAALRNTQVRAKILSSGFLGSTKYREASAQVIQENVEMYDHISYVEMRRLYDGCSFVVVPLIRGFDYPAGVTAVVEAMAMGKPVIATYSHGIQEFIQDSVTGFWVEPGDPMKMQEKILFLWYNPQLAREMGKRARESVKMRVDMPRFVDELASILTRPFTDATRPVDP